MSELSINVRLLKETIWVSKEPEFKDGCNGTGCKDVPTEPPDLTTK
jgi:hypothetical protein